MKHIITQPYPGLSCYAYMPEYHLRNVSVKQLMFCKYERLCLRQFVYRLQFNANNYDSYKFVQNTYYIFASFICFIIFCGHSRIFKKRRQVQNCYMEDKFFELKLSNENYIFGKWLQFVLVNRKLCIAL